MDIGIKDLVIKQKSQQINSLHSTKNNRSNQTTNSMICLTTTEGLRNAISMPFYSIYIYGNACVTRQIMQLERKKVSIYENTLRKIAHKPPF